MSTPTRHPRDPRPPREAGAAGPPSGRILAPSPPVAPKMAAAAPPKVVHSPARPPHGDAGAFAEWADAVGVTAAADQTIEYFKVPRIAREARARIREMNPPLTPREVIGAPNAPRLARALDSHARGELELYAHQVMVQAASRVKAEREMEEQRVAKRRAVAEALARPELHPALAALAAKLAGLRAGCADYSGSMPFAQARLGFTAVPAALHFEASYLAGYNVMRVDVGLIGYPTRDPVPSCHCGNNNCSTVALALDSLILWIANLPAVGREPLVRFLEMPEWERALVALESSLREEGTPIAGTTGRDQPVLHAFRLVDGRGPIQLVPYLHKRLKNGAWSAGNRVGFERFHHLDSDDPNDVACRRAARTLATFTGAAVHEALDELAGTDRVYLDGLPGAPLEVRRGALTIVARALDEGGLSLRPAIDGSEVDWTTFARLAAHAPVGPRVRLAVVDRERRRCTLLRASPSLVRALTMLSQTGSDFPAAAIPSLIGRLGSTGIGEAIELPPSLLGEQVAADPRVLLRLTLLPRGLAGEALVRPLAEGPAFAPGVGPRRLSAPRDGRTVFVERDLAGEPARVAAALAGLPAVVTGGTRIRCDGDEAALDLVALFAERADLIVEWADAAAAPRVVGRAESAALKVEVEDRPDWFGLSGGLEVDGHRVELAALLEAVREGRRYVRADAQHFLLIADELRQRLLRASEVIFAGRSGLAAGPAAAHALSDLFDGAGEALLSANFQRLVSRIRSARTEEAPLPESLTATLRPYQVEGYRWLMRLAAWGVGGCLADDMGLGKTLQALAAIVARGGAGPSLVVAPTSVCWNWAREAARFAPSLSVHLFRDTDRAGDLDRLGANDLLIASYGLVTRHADDLARRRFVTLVLDEGQAMKNADTRRARAVRGLDAEWRVALTGTPVENHVGELWSLMRVVAPGLLGSWEQFRERFALRIERDRDPERRRALAQVVRPFLLRRLKQEVAPELPPRTEIRRVVPLSDEEWKNYDTVRLALVARLSGALDDQPSEKRRFEVLAAITRLRLLACHPRLHDKESPLPSAKLSACLELFDELREGGHRALVFSQFTSHLALVRAALEARGTEYLYLDGATPEAERARRVEAFQRGEAELFLISLKAGGTGLNLTAADYVVHLDPWWNPAVEDQATDRAHRIGQDKPVTVYRLVSQGTIEEAILSLHERKRDLASSLLTGAHTAGKLDVEELIDLIRRGERGASDAEG